MGSCKKKLVSIRRKQFTHEPTNEAISDSTNVVSEENPVDIDTVNIEETTSGPPSSIVDDIVPEAKEKELPEMTKEEKDFLSIEKIKPDSVEDFNKEIRKMLVDRHNIYSSVRETFISRHSASETQGTNNNPDLAENVFDDRNHRVITSSRRASRAPVNRRMSYLSLNRTL
jgi:hypothetical protein